MSASRSLDRMLDHTRNGRASGTVVQYGCGRWRKCKSRQESPPYDPEQPLRCSTHDQWMTTEIPAEGEMT